MAEYIYFTNEEKLRAGQTSLVDLLQSQGETLKRCGSEYVWGSGSDKVNIRDNLWFHHYEQVGGNTIDFVRKFYNKDYDEALQFILGNEAGQIIQPKPRKPKVPFKLPNANDTMRRVESYLLDTRKIDREVYNFFVRNKMIYESEELHKEKYLYHNAIFVGYDMEGTPKHAHKRGLGKDSTFKGNVDSSEPEYSFHWFGTDNELYLFEAPIDMLSYISLNKDNWKEHSYAASCSVSDKVLFQCLKDNPNIKKVFLCLDNDEAGHKADKRISDKLFVQGIESEILVPHCKDWNEDLKKSFESEETECQTLHL